MSTTPPVPPPASPPTPPSPPTVSGPPAGAPISADGKWWWDGAAWVPVQGRSMSWNTPGGAAAVFLLALLAIAIIVIIIGAITGAQPHDNVNQDVNNVFSNISNGLNQ